MVDGDVVVVDNLGRRGVADHLGDCSVLKRLRGPGCRVQDLGCFATRASLARASGVLRPSSPLFHFNHMLEEELLQLVGGERVQFGVLVLLLLNQCNQLLRAQLLKEHVRGVAFIRGRPWVSAVLGRRLIHLEERHVARTSYSGRRLL